MQRGKKISFCLNLFRDDLSREFPGWLPWRTILSWKKINLESLEIKRLRADLTLVYKILFGVIRTKGDKLFSLRNQPQLRGHNYTLNKPRCNSQTRQVFFNIRLINLWNSLPADSTHFSSFHKYCWSVGIQVIYWVYTQYILCNVHVVFMFFSFFSFVNSVYT